LLYWVQKVRILTQRALRDGTLRVTGITADGSCWLEALKSPDDVLPEVGDEVKLINGRVATLKDLDGGVLSGQEGTLVELAIEKADHSGFFQCVLTRRVPI
jgi:hypothetical protein